MSLRDRAVRRESHWALAQIRPASIRPQSAREMYAESEPEMKFENPRAQRLLEKAIRAETRYERRKRK